MTKRLGQVLALAGMVSVLASCGGSSSGGGGSTTSSGPGFFITISNMTFSPQELDVPPGATVTVVNQDAMDHTVTSEAASGSFTPAAVGGVQFDTGGFTGTKTFTIPAAATNGTVIPYYCRVHTSLMGNHPDATIKIDDSAQPGPAPGGGSSGGGNGY